MRVHCPHCETTVQHEYTYELLQTTYERHQGREDIFAEVCRTLESKFTTDCEEARLLNVCDQIHSS